MGRRPKKKHFLFGALPKIGAGPLPKLILTLYFKGKNKREKVAQNARGGMWVIWAMLKRKSVFFWGFSLKKYQDVMQNCTKTTLNDIPNLKSKSKGLEIDLKCLRRRQLFHPNMVTPASKDLSTERKKESRHPAMLYYRKMASTENLLPF